MAAVYLAHEIELRRDVAIKVMSPGLLFTEGMVDRFREEARTIAKLDHPNIITVHSVRSLADLHFFVMKFVEGRSLDFVLRQHGPLPLDLTLCVLAQVGQALAYAHRRGVIHRDLKPANLLVHKVGRVVVTDFGIAKVTEARGLTQSGVLIGTLEYMSPEQWLGREVSGASDQYALGVLTYVLLCGQPPFRGTRHEIEQGHVYGRPPSLRAARPDCPAEMEAAVLRMLAKDPADRWPTLEEAMAALGASRMADTDGFRAELGALAAPDPGITSLLHPSVPSAPSPAPSWESPPPAPQPLIATGSPPPQRGSDRRWVAARWAAIALVAMSGVGIGTAMWAMRGARTEMAPTPGHADTRKAPDQVAGQEGTPAPVALSLTLLGGGTGTVEGGGLECRLRDGEVGGACITRVAVGGAITLNATAADGSRFAGWSGACSGEGECRVRPDVDASVQATFVASKPSATPTPAPWRIRIAPREVSLTVGRVEELQYAWTGGSPEVAPPGRPRWHVQGDSVVRVSAEGRIEGVGAGEAWVVARTGAMSDSAHVLVRAAPAVARVVRVTPSDLDLEEGSASVLRATASDALGAPVPGARVSWTSDDAGVASVDLVTGEVQGVSPGSTHIRATSGGATGVIDVTVVPRHPVSPAFSELDVGGTASCASSGPGGEVVCWGDGLAAPRRLGTSGDFATLSVGLGHRCATRTGLAYCWGNNAFGQIGDGSTTSSETPRAVASDVHFSMVGVGDTHTCGLGDAGEAWCWGSNRLRQLGNVSTKDASSPVRVALQHGETFSGLAVGANHTCGIVDGGEAYCWGDGASYQLGNGVRDFQSAPYPVSGGHAFKQLAAGELFTCGLTDAGEAFCWGDNQFGQLGDIPNHERTRERPEPTPVSRSHVYAQITAGRRHACGLASDQRIYCWGNNETGQLGTGATARRTSTPELVQSSESFLAVRAGNLHTCALTVSKQVFCWGDNSQGQVSPDLPSRPQLTPVRVGIFPHDR